MCASLSSELVFVDALKFELWPIPLPDLYKVPGRQLFYWIQCSQGKDSASGNQHLGWPCRPTGMCGTRKNCPRTSELNPGCCTGNSSAGVDSQNPLSLVPPLRSSDKMSAWALLFGFTVNDFKSAEANKKVIKIVRLSLTPRCCVESDWKDSH